MEEYEEKRVPRGNKSRTQLDTYSPERMERMKQILEMSADDGEPQYYSIHVDGMIVVKKTTDTEKFDNYMAFIDHQTKCVELRTFFGDSPNCNTFRLLVSAVPSATLQGVPQLGAIEIGEKINEAVTRERQQNKIEALEKDNAKLEEENAALRKKLKKYKKLEEESRANNKSENRELIKTGVELFGPFLAAKLGATSPTPVDGLAATPQTIDVEIEAVNESESSEVDKQFEAMKAEYSEKELARALNAMQLFADHPELKSEFETVITNKINENG
jgi:hypothetical protein